MMERGGPGGPSLGERRLAEETKKNDVPASPPLSLSNGSQRMIRRRRRALKAVLPAMR